jgi:Fic family protein
VPEFASIEEYLGRNTAAYYDVLAEVGGGGWHPDRDTRPWLRFCLVAHYRQLQTLLRRVDEAERTWAELDRIVQRHGLPSRAVAPLYDATLGFRLRNPSYRSAVESAEGTEIADQTASRDLRALVEAQVLVAHGERRGRFYTAGVELEALRGELRANRTRQLADPFDIVAERRQGTLFPPPPA